MKETNTTLICLIFAFSFLLGFFFWARRAWVSLIIIGAFVIRGLLAMWLESGLKYDFVWDSLHYEYRAWLLSQRWMSADTFLSLTRGGSYQFNYYERLLAALFWFLGKDTLLATLINCFFSVLSIYLIYRIQTDFFYDPKDSRRRILNVPAMMTSIILTFYPAFLIWSATNIRDPLYFLFSVSFFYFFVRLFSKRLQDGFLGKCLSFFLCVVSFWGVRGLRSYLTEVFLGSVALGAFLSLVFRKFRVWKVLSLLSLSGLLGAIVFQVVSPGVFGDLMLNIDTSRKAFGNLKLLDFVTKSSFALDRDLRSVKDVLLFLPTSLSHYFFGPFPWEIVDSVQAISFLETMIVWGLAYPTLVGIKTLYRRARFETTVLLTFVVIMVLAQSLVISNMGTIFRHRTLPFLFLSIFAGEGLYEIFKKNFQALFKVEYWRTRATRSEYLSRLESFWV
jgi:hypothetical protein